MYPLCRKLYVEYILLIDISIILRYIMFFGMELMDVGLVRSAIETLNKIKKKKPNSIQLKLN